METTSNKYNHDLQSCVITTGISSLNFYNEQMQPFEQSDFLLYNLMRVSSIKNITKVAYYQVIIDFRDNNIKEVVFELLNYLLTFNVEIDVKIIYSEMIISDDAEECMSLLNRLSKHKLIKLETINKSLELKKEKENKYWIKRLRNVFFYGFR